MRRLADTVLIYSTTQAEELRRLMPKKQIQAAPNGIYSSARAVAPTDGRDAHDFVVVGRLVDEKKPLLILEAYLAAADELPPRTRLVFVGDGPLRPILERRAADADAEELVYFAGTITDFDELRRVFRGALASVLPGSAGLSLIQSLWFGVPVIVGRSGSHGPEIEAVQPDLNAIVVESDSRDALRAALLRVIAERVEWTARRPSIAAACVEAYSLEKTVAGFKTAIDDASL
jgi:glycosyltransferase involved in cell wall biosynthesis